MVFQPGNPGGPGRPKGMLNDLTTSFKRLLAEDFQKNGVGAIEAAREKDPVGYLKLIRSFMPTELKIAQTPLDEMSDAELTDAIETIRTAMGSDAGKASGSESAPNGGKPH